MEIEFFSTTLWVKLHVYI